MTNYETLMARNRQHRDNPQPGDYWSEHFCAVCVIISYADGMVVLCRKKGEDAISWRWKLDQCEAIPIEEFKAWITYKNADMQDKTWADVSPGLHMGAVEEFKTVGSIGGRYA